MNAQTYPTICTDPAYIDISEEDIKIFNAAYRKWVARNAKVLDADWKKNNFRFGSECEEQNED